MSIYVYHGDQPAVSRAALEAQLEKFRQSGLQLTTLDGKKITPAELSDALEQDDFFGGAKAIVINHLFSRPKSKLRDHLLSIIAGSRSDILIWEPKKLTASALKPLGKPQIFVSPDAKSIWALTRLLAPDNNNPRFFETYQKTLIEASGNTDPGVYILATILWQVQQLIDTSQNNFHGAPFARTSTQNQAGKFTASQLLQLHQDLIWLDYKAKTGQLTLPLSHELLLFLAGLR